jgi:hypothetical protein
VSPCDWVTKTLRTTPLTSSTESTKKTRLADADSRNCPAATCATSSRCSNRRWYSSVWRIDQGATKKDSRATSTAKGAAKPSTGRTQAVGDWPLANQITISESRYWRVSAISTAMNSVSTSRTGRKPTEAKAIRGSTLAVSTPPPAARPRIRISVVVAVIVNSVAKMTPARLDRSRRSAFVNSIGIPGGIVAGQIGRSI